MLWRHDIERDIQSKTRIVQPGRTPAIDVNGDGRIEIVVNLFNETGDGLWHLAAYDALTGETVFNIPGAFLSGAADVNGDGVPELFVTRTSKLLVIELGNLALLQAKGSQATPLWERHGGKWAKAAAPLPFTSAVMPDSGIDIAAVVTANLTGGSSRGFFVLEDSMEREGQCLAFTIQGDNRVKEE